MEEATGAADGPLTFAGYEIDDWPRWRQTKLTGLWQVGEAFDPAQDSPFLEVRTPAGDTVGSLTEVAPPALVWYPPERWQPGETIRITSLPLYLPATWGLVTETRQAALTEQAVLGNSGGEALMTAQQRGERDRLSPLPTRPQALADAGTATFAIDGAAPLTLDATLPEASIWPGATVDVLMRWQGDAWPQDLSTFVHLRRDGETVSQADGQPRYFVRPPLSAAESPGAESSGAKAMSLIDWRQLSVPDIAIDDGEGEWSLVVGIYDPSTGERVNVVDDQGNPTAQEVTVGTLRWSEAPVPDQACALIPATCASQPSR